MLAFKKSLLSTLFIAGISSAFFANASSTATLVWNGVVPGSTAGDDLIITGIGGSLTAHSGSITAKEDGTFISDEIVLEAHENTGDASAPVIGDLAAASWTLSNASLTYDNVNVDTATLAVVVNGSTLAVGEGVGGSTGLETITTSVKQTTSLEPSLVAESAAQVSVTFLADAI